MLCVCVSVSSLTVLFFAMEAIYSGGYCCCVVRELATFPALTALRSLQFYIAEREFVQELVEGVGDRQLDSCARENINFRRFFMQLVKRKGRLISLFYLLVCLDSILCGGLNI